MKSVAVAVAGSSRKTVEGYVKDVNEKKVSLSVERPVKPFTAPSAGRGTSLPGVPSCPWMRTRSEPSRIVTTTKKPPTA